MSKPFLLFRGPVKTRSGYGSHSRDLLETLYQMDLFDIKIDSCPWGSTPMNALESDNLFHKWIESNIITVVSSQPDIYIQVTVPNEFQRIGNFNIGITAGIETTMIPKDWVDGCNRMDLILTTSVFSKNVIVHTIYNENDSSTNRLIKQHKVNTPVEILFEGINTKIFNKNYLGCEFDIKENFAYLFVGHWLSGELGQDRKDVGMLIKCFAEAFKDEVDKPALILKTSSATFSIKERESFRKRIEDLVRDYNTPPPIYLLFGDLTDSEMNDLYNHPKVKSMISITKGEGFGRPLLEFSISGKPVIASNWSGHVDFLPVDKAIMVGGNLTPVHETASNHLLLKESKWFTANYDEVVGVLRMVKNDYDKFLEKSEILGKENFENFSMEKMKEKFKNILLPHITVPQQTKFILPTLTKIN